MCTAANHPPDCRCGWGTQDQGQVITPTEVLPRITWTGKPWWRHIRTFSLPVVTEAIHAGATIDERDDRGYSALLWAAIRGHLDIISFLLSSGADIEAKDCFGQTAVYFACVNLHDEITALLLDCGADASHLDIAGKLQHSERHLALEKSIENAVVRGAEEDLIEFLDRWESDGRREFRSINPVLAAVKAKRYAVLPLFKRFQLDVSRPDERGFSPLMWACIWGGPAMISSLLQLGADPHARGVRGQTALYLLEANGHGQLRHLLDATT